MLHLLPSHIFESQKAMDHAYMMALAEGRDDLMTMFEIGEIKAGVEAEDEKEKEIAALESEKDELESRVDDLEEQVSGLMLEIDDLKGEAKENADYRKEAETHAKLFYDKYLARSDGQLLDKFLTWDRAEQKKMFNDLVNMVWAIGE